MQASKSSAAAGVILVSAILGASVAMAADMRVKAPPVVAPPVAATWAGCYVGGNAGWIGRDSGYTTQPTGSYSTAPGGAAPPNAAGTGDFAVDIAALRNS